MKVLLKKVGILILIIACIGVKKPLTVSAQQTYSKFSISTKINEFLQIAALDPEQYGLSNVDLNNLQLCEPISPYTITENGELKEIQEIKYYFICSNGQPVADVIFCKDSNLSIPSLTFETETALKLSDFLKTNNEFTLLHNDNDISILPSGNKLMYSVDSPIGLSMTKVESNNMVTSSYPSYYLLNVPFVPQGNDNLCWAACAASVGKYKTGISRTARDVADQLEVGYDDGANISLTSEALSNVFGILSTAVSGYMQNISYIADELIADKPIIAGFANPSYGHMVVICGYSASTQGAVLIVRDPNHSSTKMVSPGVDSYGNYTWVISYYSSLGLLYWYQSVFLN